MKRLFPLLVAAMLPALVSAEAIDATRAGAIAADFMQLLDPGRTAPMKKASVKTSEAENGQQAYYIFNAPGGGYVVVAGDDRLGTVLGYSRSGAIDTDHVPESLAGLLASYETAYRAVAAGEIAGSPSEIWKAPQTIVEPLLGDIEWGQDAPFNSLTPTYISQGKTANYYTGCVACAATQIMRLYGYPLQGTGSKTYTDPLSKQTLSADFGNTVYDWANMPNAVPAAPTEAQTKAYSTLAAHMGVALEMQYEPNGSGTYEMLVPYALRNYFGYDAAIRSHNRAYYSTSEWMDMIKAEIDAGRPVFYGGSSDSGPGGHAFVIDGYDSADFVHVNWGWYGKSNGYFMINHLEPSSLGTGGGTGGYNLNQDMVTGIQPAREASVRDHAIYGATRMSLDGPWNGTFTAMTFIENIDMEPFSGSVATLLTDADGNIAASLGGKAVAVPGFAGGYAGTLQFTDREIPATVSGVPDGDYRIRLGYKADGASEWHILRHPKGLPAYADAHVSNGSISISARHTPAPDCVIREAISTDGDLYAGGNALVRFTVENRSADFVVSGITLRLTKTDDTATTFDATVAKTVYDQSTEPIELLMPVASDAPAGEYYLTALVKNGDAEYLFDDSDAGPVTVTLRPASTTPVVRAASPLQWRSAGSDDGTISQGETFYGVISLRNAATAGTAKVLARFVNESTGESAPLVQINLTFDDSRAKTATFGRYIPFDPGKYRVELYQISDNHAETLIANYDEPAVIEVKPSDAIVAEMTAFDFPDRLMQGTNYSGSLSYKALRTTRTNLYVRVRRLTNSGGEIAYAKFSNNFTEGTGQTLDFKYKPGATLDDGLYMIIAETGSTQSQIPMGNYAAYGRLVAIGNVDFSAADIIEAEESAAAVWVEGHRLRIATAGDNTVEHIAVYNIAGALAAHDTCELAALPDGFYMVEISFAGGKRTTAKIILR